MKLLIKILAGTIPGIIILFSSILFFCLCRRRQPKQQQVTSHINKGVHVATPGQESFQAAVAKSHNKSNVSNRNSLRFHHLHDHQPFSWDANPQLISSADVIKNGWSRFVFADRSAVPRSPPLWSLCVPSQSQPQQQQQIEELMQTVKVVDNSPTPCTRIMSLPLPGPTLIGSSSFPQEAYFEIKILHLRPLKQSNDRHIGNSADNDHSADNDRSKLIKDGHTKLQSDALVYAVCDGEIKTETKSVPREEKEDSSAVVCLGLTAGGSNQTKSIPGTYPGSIGFQSNGSVCLDGINLVSESSRTEWAAVDRVIGCGFSPNKKKVFFTVDSVLVHVIRCNSEVYRSPLYPVLAAANLDVIVSVNLGQAEFKYGPANAHRTANPSSPPSFTYNSIRFGYNEDGLGMIDSPSITDSKSSSKRSKRSKDQWDDGSLVMELDKESDLFEIALNY